MEAHSLSTGGPPTCCAWFGGCSRPASKSGSPSTTLRLVRTEFHTQGPARRAASPHPNLRFPQAGPRSFTTALRAHVQSTSSPIYYSLHLPWSPGRGAVKQLSAPFYREENHKRLPRAMGLISTDQSPHLCPPPCPIPVTFTESHVLAEDPQPESNLNLPAPMSIP